MADLWIILYPWLKAVHVMAVIAWMAGLFYLPRLYVYHCGAEPGSAQSETFKVMELKLLSVIMTPAMIVSWALGIALMFEIFPALKDFRTAGWMHGKLFLAVLMTVFHGFLVKYRRDLAADKNYHAAKFYRIINEFPTLLMAGIVILVIVKPF
jgi:putative membrane protein